MKKSLKDQALEIPWIYNLVQYIFGSAELYGLMETVLSKYSKQEVLELGCGTGAFSPKGFKSLTVTDVNQDYLDQINVPCKKILASAAQLPFKDESFDMVFAAGLYHHLSDEDYHQSMKEVRRVLRPSGVFINLDNLPPTKPYRLIASLTRKMDRGQFVRTIPDQVALMKKELVIDESLSGSYAWCGLEYVLHRCKKQ